MFLEEEHIMQSTQLTDKLGVVVSKKNGAVLQKQAPHQKKNEHHTFKIPDSHHFGRSNKQQKRKIRISHSLR